MADWAIEFRSLPNNLTEPRLGLSRPMARCNSVVFPDPEGPHTATHSSASTVTVTPASALTSRPRKRYVFQASFTWRAAVTNPILRPQEYGSRPGRRSDRLTGVRRRASAGSTWRHLAGGDRVNVDRARWPPRVALDIVDEQIALAQRQDKVHCLGPTEQPDVRRCSVLVDRGRDRDVA